MSSNNTSETVFLDPGATRPGGNIYTDRTVWQPEEQEEQQSILIPYGTTIGGYMVMDPISTEGRESVVYKAGKAAEEYALKLYKRELELSEVKMQTLMKLDCPYIAKLCDYGEYEGQPYEVYRYYKNGTVANRGKIEDERLKHYINQLNEALHCLHTANGNSGMVHGDLKPSNIFLSDDEQSVILGDFGVSNVRNAAGSHFARICGTPEFAPPSTGLMDQMKKDPAYDYGSLGLVVYYLATGYSYFVGCSSEQIAEGWEKGIALPDGMDSRIKLLLDGLLQADEKCRFGYEQVHDWYKGSFVQAVQPKKLYSVVQTDVKASLWFGIFNGEVINVTSPTELVVQMKKHWQQAGMKLNDSNFYHFVDKFYPDRSMSRKIRSFLEEGDIDAAVFKTIYTLSDNAELVYKEKTYGTIAKVIDAVEQQDEDARELISKGLLMFYINAMEYSAQTYEVMQEVMSLKNCPESYRIRIVGYIFADQKEYNGMRSIDDLRRAVSNMTLKEIDELVLKEDFLAWLYVAGMPELSLSLVVAKGSLV